MADVAIDQKAFRKRLKLLYDSWKVRLDLLGPSCGV
jgi:hypothetical protein